MWNTKTTGSKDESKILLGTDMKGDESVPHLHSQLMTAKIPGLIPPQREQLGLVGNLLS